MILTALTALLFKAKTPTIEQRRAEMLKNNALALEKIEKEYFPNNYTIRRKEYLRKNGLPDDYTLRPSGRKSAFHKDI